MKRKQLTIIALISVWCCTTILLNAQAVTHTGFKKNLSSAKDSLVILDSLVNLNKVSDNPRALHYAQNAMSVAHHSNDPKDLVKANILMGMAYFQKENDTSYFYYNEALKIAKKENFEKEKIPIMYNLALFYNDVSDYQTAMTLLDSTIYFARLTGAFSNVSNCFNMLGSIKMMTHNYKEARMMFDSAFFIAKEHSLLRQMGVAQANIASTEENFNISVNLLRQALGYLKKADDTEEEMAAVFISIGNRSFNLDSQIFYYQSAIQLATGGNLPRTLMGAYNGMTYSYLGKNNVAKAEACIKDNALPLAIKENDYDWLSTLYDSYADVCVAKGDIKSAYQNQKNALTNRMNAIKQQASGQVRLLTALMDLKNKEITIQNEGKEILIQRNRAQKMELFLTIAILLALISVFFVFFIQQRSKIRLHKEEIRSAKRLIEMEEGEKKRTAQELHDITGQLVMGITGEIENLDIPDDENKEELQSKIKELGKSIRQISHRMNPAMIEHFTFDELIIGQCEDVQRLSKIPVHLKIDETFPEFQKDLVLHFYRIVQELLTNATKYISGGEVEIKIHFNSNKLNLLYTDTGPGFEVNEKSKSGMGIMNIFERTKLIGGHAVLNSSPGDGTSWEITIPVK